MKNNKPSLKSLDKKRFLFFNIGLIVSLSVVLIAFQWKSVDKAYVFDDVEEIPYADVDHVPMIVPQPKPEIPQPEVPKEEPKKIIDKFTIDKTNTTEVTTVIAPEPTTPDTLIDIGPISFEPEPEEVFLYALVEDKPVFPGCEGLKGKERDVCFEQKMHEHIKSVFKYPPIAKANGSQGTVFVQFVIDKEGNVTQPKVARGVDTYLDAEAIRIVKSLPQVTPAKQRNKPVKMAYSVRIVFQLR